MNQRQQGDDAHRQQLPVQGIPKQELKREPEVKLPSRDLRVLPGQNPAPHLVWPEKGIQVPRDLEVWVEGLLRQAKELIQSQFHSRLSLRIKTKRAFGHAKFVA